MLTVCLSLCQLEALVRCGRYKAAYLLAASRRRSAEVAAVLAGAEGAGQTAVAAICRHWLQRHHPQLLPASGEESSPDGAATPPPGTGAVTPGTAPPAAGTGTPTSDTGTPAPGTGTPTPGTGTPGTSPPVQTEVGATTAGQDTKATQACR